MKHLFYFIGLLMALGCANKSTESKEVAIQPYVNFNPSLIDSISQTITSKYGMKVTILESIPLPKAAYVNIKSPRYRADSIIKYQKRDLTGEFDYILGLTEKDISTTKKNKDRSLKEPESKYADWGIFGLGYRPGPSCIVSTYRLDKNVNHTKFMSRFKKVVLHELGHNFGLPHCDSGKPCVMEDAAEKISTVDNAPYSICEVCENDLN